MVSAVTTGGYQAYSYQQAVNPQIETIRGGENRIQQRPNPIGDSQRGDQREASSRDENTQGRGKLVDLTA